jgi:hypothetical protein
MLEDRPGAHFEQLGQAVQRAALDPHPIQLPRLVLQRADQLDGDHYEILTPAAEALAGKHPPAATLLLRAMIDFSLTQARSTRYRHATRHLMECESLASSIADFAPFETHEAYADRLKREHGRKSSFWSGAS